MGPLLAENTGNMNNLTLQEERVRKDTLKEKKGKGAGEDNHVAGKKQCNVKIKRHSYNTTDNICDNILQIVMNERGQI